MRFDADPGMGRERGMVTAETAVALTGLVAILLGFLWAVALVALQVRCQDAARDTARAMARGESRQVSLAEGLRSAPEGARIGIAVAGGLVTARVRLDARPPWPVAARLPAVPLEAAAVVALEPGVDGSGTQAAAAQSASARSTTGRAASALSISARAAAIPRPGRPS